MAEVAARAKVLNCGLKLRSSPPGYVRVVNPPAPDIWASSSEQLEHRLK
jgi:hypothetical protein